MLDVRLVIVFAYTSHMTESSLCLVCVSHTVHG